MQVQPVSSRMRSSRRFSRRTASVTDSPGRRNLRYFSLPSNSMKTRWRGHAKSTRAITRPDRSLILYCGSGAGQVLRPARCMLRVSPTDSHRLSDRRDDETGVQRVGPLVHRGHPVPQHRLRRLARVQQAVDDHEAVLDIADQGAVEGGAGSVDRPHPVASGEVRHREVPAMGDPTSLPTTAPTVGAGEVDDVGEVPHRDAEEIGRRRVRDHHVGPGRAVAGPREQQPAFRWVARGPHLTRAVGAMTQPVPVAGSDHAGDCLVVVPQRRGLAGHPHMPHETETPGRCIHA